MITAPSCLQDHDRYLFRLQPSHPVPPGRVGMAGRQRLGRPGARAGGGVDHPAEAGGTQGLCHPDMQHIPAHGTAGSFSTTKWSDEEAQELLGPADGHSEGVGGQHQEAAEAAMPKGDLGGPGEVTSLGKAERYRVRPNT